MTVNTTNITSGPYDGNGIADTFSYTFKVEDKTQLSVYETDDNGVETLLTVDTHYTVAGIGVDGGGTITRTAGPLPTNYKWFIRSNYQETQLTAFSSQGAFFPELHENAMDKLTFLIQQILDTNGRSIRISDTETPLISTELANVATRAGKVLSFDATGLLSYTSAAIAAGDFTHVTTTAAMTALVGATVGVDVVQTAEFSTGDGGGGTYDVVLTSSVTPNARNIIIGVADPLVSFVLRTTNIINAEQYGFFGDNAGSPYTLADLNLIFSLTDVKEVKLPNETITFNNTAGALSFQSNVKYTGGSNTFFQITDESQRCFSTNTKTGFQLENIRVLGTETAGDEETYIGGGYFRFDNCSGFSALNCESSKSFGTGLKCVLCTDFWFVNWKSNYNQFSGLELEGCSVYLIDGLIESSKNGRYSIDDTYKPLPSTWTGTHGGRGWVIAANGDTVDQKFGKIGKGDFIENSEYGGRVFAASTKSPINFRFGEHYYKDNGAPAGTYGTIVLATDKGVDLLINSDALGESDNGYWKDVTIDRTLDYGTPMSVGGNNHKHEDTTINISGAALHVVSALSIFDGDNLQSIRMKTTGAAFNCSFGSGLPTSTSFIDCVATDCLRAFNSSPNGGINKLIGCDFTHRTTAAVVGEEGLDLSTSEWHIYDTTMDGFYRGFDIITAVPVAKIHNCITKNSVDQGIDGTAMTDQTSFEIDNNSFDSAFPGILATFEYNRRGSLSRKRFTFNSNPSAGGANAGSGYNWVVGDRVHISTSGVTNVCTVAGTPGTWA